ncbi:MAG TPA: metal ABC transporter ATP-binding protein [Chitinispirillaceae bacterium]|nr:metal ABC transporter ATP-binding protein [Chitinispirillaceae bacterium]
MLETRGFAEIAVLGFKNVNVTLQGRKILHNVNLHIHCGQLAVIIGPNGAGKTTLLRAMLNELPYTGKINFLSKDGRSGRAFRIGYVPQKLDIEAFSPVTVLDLFAASLSKKPLWLGISSKVKQQAMKGLSDVEAGHLLNQQVGSLSGGQLQRVLLALALTPVPDLLLLDEPVSGVDPSGIELFYRMVSNLRKTYHMAIVMISHDLSTTARYADRMLFLNHSVICDDKPYIALQHPDVIGTFGQFTINNIGQNPNADGVNV